MSMKWNKYNLIVIQEFHKMQRIYWNHHFHVFSVSLSLKMALRWKWREASVFLF